MGWSIPFWWPGCILKDQIGWEDPVWQIWGSVSNTVSILYIWHNKGQASSGPYVIAAFFFFFNFILFLNFTKFYLFCQISKWIRHRYTCVHHPEPSSLLPPHTIPLGRPSAPARSIQYRASNLDWQLVSYMILYMFQCHSPKSSHPLPLHRVHKTVPS